MKRLFLIVLILFFCSSFQSEARACGRCERPVLRAATAAPKALLKRRPVRKVGKAVFQVRPVRRVLFGR
jgi:hypothetical protein